MPPQAQETTRAEGISTSSRMTSRISDAQSLNDIDATKIRRIHGQRVDMRRLATVALIAAAALGALLLALWLDATATPPVI